MDDYIFKQLKQIHTNLKQLTLSIEKIITYNQAKKDSKKTFLTYDRKSTKTNLIHLIKEEEL